MNLPPITAGELKRLLSEMPDGAPCAGAWEGIFFALDGVALSRDGVVLLLVDQDRNSDQFSDVDVREKWRGVRDLS